MKGCNGPSILCAALLFGAFLIAPAFAEMKKVDDEELAKTKASVTGASVKDLKEGVAADSITFDRNLPLFSLPGSTVREDLFKIPYTETWTYTFGPDNPTHWGTINGTITR
jgi:hypothetical protein